MINNLSKQDQEMKELLEEVRCVTDAIVQPGETFLSDIDIKIANLILKHTARAREETAQECYLECLAVECGEGECATAIKTRFNLKSNNSSNYDKVSDGGPY